MQTLQLTQPDDAHLHLRDDAYLKTTVPATARQCARAIVMPNLKPPVTTLAALQAYKARIMAAIPEGLSFQPLMTLYLTDDTTPQSVIAAAASKEVTAIKLYPAGVTTHSEAGVTQLAQLDPVFAAMESVNLPLLIHGETSDPAVDIFDRERDFLGSLEKMIQKFPRLRIVLEHITTAEAVDFVLAAPEQVAATITPHHLLLNRQHLLAGGVRPHYYCLPILKRRRHQEALIAAATRGNKKFFLGTDSAPHAIAMKETACGCAGIYSAHAAIELYAEAFERAGALDKLEAFSSHYAADFYQLPRNTRGITLVKKPWKVMQTLAFGDETVVPLWAGETLSWQLLEEITS
jgi:dihydroorotase